MKALVKTVISFKEWKQAQADQLGIKLHTFEMRLARGLVLYPAGLKRGRKRAVNVTILQKTNLEQLPV